MASEAQRRAVKSFRKRRRKAGVVRFEVAAPARDKELIRGVARRLSEAGPGAEEVRAELRKLTGESFLDEVGGIWRALRESPLVGADVEFPREHGHDRKVDL
jgi:hypothetical protein